MKHIIEQITNGNLKQALLLLEQCNPVTEAVEIAHQYLACAVCYGTSTDVMDLCEKAKEVLQSGI